MNISKWWIMIKFWFAWSWENHVMSLKRSNTHLGSFLPCLTFYNIYWFRWLYKRCKTCNLLIRLFTLLPFLMLVMICTNYGRSWFVRLKHFFYGFIVIANNCLPNTFKGNRGFSHTWEGRTLSKWRWRRIIWISFIYVKNVIRVFPKLTHLDAKRLRQSCFIMMNKILNHKMSRICKRLWILNKFF